MTVNEMLELATMFSTVEGPEIKCVDSVNVKVASEMPAKTEAGKDNDSFVVAATFDRVIDADTGVTDNVPRSRLGFETLQVASTLG